jgi:flagellar hook assembly protein FlgD
VRIQIYDVAGRAVATLLDGTRPAGYHGVFWDGSRIDGGRASAGIYFARMEAGSEVQTTKFVLVQ